ncbi:hypothetical protein [Leptotrichia sp. oral taxon 879]|uniref:Uncharacterized protein n=1 Tax=Leptotrichia mesophila TaxID=3239303 RepID=A0AB39VBL6_9FUSO|nr:hypothetical protein [Leptotrichia sp. oral taxon 879]ERK53151.1 hypothetical protein HMPREF1552_00578 [Leptotrichia sp. oral taxon 879 str. F0557]
MNKNAAYFKEISNIDTGTVIQKEIYQKDKDIYLKGRADKRYKSN